LHSPCQALYRPALQIGSPEFSTSAHQTFQLRLLRPLDQLVAPTDRISFAGTGNSIRVVYRLLSADLPKPRSHYWTSVLTVDNRAKADLEAALTRAAGKAPLPLMEGVANVVLKIAPDAVSFTRDISCLQ